MSRLLRATSAQRQGVATFLSLSSKREAPNFQTAQTPRAVRNGSGASRCSYGDRNVAAPWLRQSL